MPVKVPSTADAAREALKAMQDDAKQKGLDRMTMDEIKHEIATYRREKRLARPSEYQPPNNADARRSTR